MPDDRPHDIPKRFADRYRIEAPIGEGAHASTWRGWDERLERPVAIKLLHQRLTDDPIFVQRFQAEAKVAASVRQSNVVDIYDFGQESGTLYIVMQFIDGEDLKALIRRAAPISIRDTRRIIGNVLDGLQAIHAAGIVHRDIKPQNVLVGRDGIARVTDFGIAEVDDTAGLTGEGLTIGTVDYMAPEQAQGLSVTPAADLYATGVMLYEMLTGTLPFQGKNSRETMLQHINGPLTPPSSRLPEHGITPTMDAVIAQSLAKEPARRFGSARAMKQAVGQALAAAPAGAQTQATTVMPAQSHLAPAPTQRHNPYQQAAPTGDEGAGLTGAFRGLVALLLIGVLGVAIWGVFQFVDFDDLNLPTFGTGQEETPTATLPPEEPDSDAIVPIEPDAPADEAPPADVVPTEPAQQEPEPTQVVEPTVEPAAPTEVSPIEPIEPEVPTDDADEDPAIEPSGYDEYYWPI